jgi:hypothetical protein
MAKLERVGITHPEVCQGNTGQGPCEYKRSPGSDYCSIHGAGASIKAQERAELRNLRITNATYGQRAKEIAGSGGLKNLTDEIALMRVSLEAIFNNINNANEMLLYVDRLDKLANTISKLTESWQRLQEKNKELLGRDTVLAIFDQLMEKIVERVTDPDVIRSLAEDGYNIIAKGLGG